MNNTPPEPASPGGSAQPGLLKNSDFLCLWWVGLASFLIRWLEILVFGVFTYQHTNSAFMVAMMTMLRMLPMALFGATFGVIAERIVRRRALLLVLCVSLITVAVLTVIAATGHLQVWHLGVASFINGTAWATDNPVRRAMIGEVAGAERMGQAMSMEVGTSNASRLAGPSMGGLLLAGYGIEGTFALATVLYASALFAALAVRYRNQIESGGQPALFTTLTRGLTRLLKVRRLVGTMWLTIVFNVFAWPVLSMVPVIGQDQLGLLAQGIGMLASTDGFGALIGAIILARISKPAWYGRIYASGVLLFLLLLPGFALATNVWLAGTALFFIGAGQAAFAVMQSTITFVAAPAGMRSQAMGLMTMCIGVAPLGFLLVGILAEAIGAPATAVTLSLSGVLVCAVSWPVWKELLGAGDRI